MYIEIIKSLKERAKEMLEDNYDRKIGDEEIYTIICELENFYTAYEKEKEKNKNARERIKKYINKIQKELDKYKIKNTNTYIQIEGNPEINGLLIQRATLEELIKEE